MTKPPSRRYLRSTVAPADRPYGLGWTFPLGLASDGDVVVVRPYADPPAPVPDGWMGVWARAETHTTVESYRNESVDAVLAWARGLGVNQIFVENQTTRQFQRDQGATL